MGLGVFFLTACGWQGEGTIVEKTHSEEYSYITLQCGSFSRNGTCTSQFPITHYVPEAWGYKIRDSKGHVHDVSASHADWDAHEVGQHFDNRKATR